MYNRRKIYEKIVIVVWKFHTTVTSLPVCFYRMSKIYLLGCILLYIFCIFRGSSAGFCYNSQNDNINSGCI